MCGDDRIVNASRIKCLDGRDKPAATPHMGREQRELVFELALFEPGDCLGRDHAAVGHDAHPPNVEMLAQSSSMTIGHGSRHGRKS